jgi:hypothetical protein
MHNRSQHALTAITLIIALLSATNAWAMRCGNQLVNKGDSQASVLKYCGEPVQKSERYVLRSGTYPSQKSGININDESLISNDRRYIYGRSEVLLEEWIYNFGPSKFMRLVRFANGIVEDVQTLEYGYREDD